MSDDERPRRHWGRLIGALVLLVIALIFVFSNTASATLHLLFLSFTLPGWVWFIVLLVIGVVIGSLFPWFRSRPRR